MNTVNDFKIGEGATILNYSDKIACTVIAMTPKSITVQEDTATLLNGFNSNAKDKLTFSTGGFLGHVSGEQRYSYSPNASGIKHTFKQTTKKGVIGVRGLITGRSHLYDYNF
jgi:hypothetical protein